jgi:hypothetical protein
VAKSQGRISIVFIPTVSSRTTFVTKKNFFVCLSTLPCHEKNKEHFDSDTAEHVLIIGFLQRCNKIKKNLDPVLVFLNNTKITRERRIEKNVKNSK